MPARVIAADPPWPFRDKLPGNGRGARKHYRLMTIDDICAFPLPSVLPDAYLFLWRVASMQEEAAQVCRAWGFTPTTELVWCKTTKNGKRHFGMGRHLRSSHETCLVGVRGKAKPKVRNIRTVFSAPVGPHSTKPDEFYEIVEDLTDGPYVELFARRNRPGWECLGDELEAA